MSGDDFAAAEENGDAAAAPDLFQWLSREVRELMPREVPVLETPPTALAFSRDFVAANRPCVVRGAVDHWPARELWTASYLSAALGDTPISVNVTPTGLGDALLSTEGVDLRYRERAGASGASSSSCDDANAPREKPPLVFVQPEARAFPSASSRRSRAETRKRLGRNPKRTSRPGSNLGRYRTSPRRMIRSRLSFLNASAATWAPTRLAASSGLATRSGPRRTR
jgi:hypothetical protein